MFSGTSGRDAIHGFGGFNVSDFSTQDHTFKKHKSNFNEQNRSTFKYAGPNALNPPKATDKKEQKLPNGMNKIYKWREQTLPVPLPGQVAGGFGQIPFASSDTSLLQWKLQHGYGQNDPSLHHLLDEQNIAPRLEASWRLQSDPYLHSDVGVPSVLGQNYFDLPTSNPYPQNMKHISRGKHDHTNLREQLTPGAWNTSNTSVATFHTYSDPELQVVNGVAGTIKATREPLNRPLLYSDLPAPPQPVVQN